MPTKPYETRVRKLITPIVTIIDENETHETLQVEIEETGYKYYIREVHHLKYKNYWLERALTLWLTEKYTYKKIKRRYLLMTGEDTWERYPTRAEALKRIKQLERNRISSEEDD